MIRKIFIILLTPLAGCSPTALPLSELTKGEPQHVRERVISQYSSLPNSEQRIAFSAFIHCKTQGVFYKTLGADGATPASFVSFADAVYTTMMLDATSISKIWSDAIRSRVDFNLAIGFVSSECQALETRENISKAMATLKKLAKNDDDRRIFEILSDLQMKVTQIEGSLINFNQSIGSIKSDFARARAGYGMK